jgi:dipeptidyl aminopeptidase/acylaminoacyl peptidase
MLLVTKTERFAAAVSHAGIANIASYWGGTGATLANGVRRRFPEPEGRHVDRSPIYAADRVKTDPTHGARARTNGRRARANRSAPFAGLSSVELLTVDGQDHHILDHAKRIVWSKSIVAWFDRWLKASRSGGMTSPQRARLIN